MAARRTQRRRLRTRVVITDAGVQLSLSWRVLLALGSSVPVAAVGHFLLQWLTH